MLPCDWGTQELCGATLADASFRGVSHQQTARSLCDARMTGVVDRPLSVRVLVALGGRTL
jgi:hypothetical protein